MLYNLFATTSKEFRDKHWKELIDLYYSTLCDTVRQLGSDPEKLFTYSDLTVQLRQFGKFGLVFGLVVIQFFFCSLDNVLDLEKSISKPSEDGQHKFVLFGDVTDSKKDDYARAINDAIGDMLDYGYIQL